MLLTVLFAMLLATIVLYMNANTMNAAAVSSLRERKDAALAAANLASEMAISNLTNLETESTQSNPVPGAPTEVVVLRDWVGQSPFSDADFDQRRIAGTFNQDGENMEYKVSVRSLREARKVGNMPVSWLRGIPDSDLRGIDATDSPQEPVPLRLFSGVYEITASARDAGISNNPNINPRQAVTATQKTLVTLKYDNPLNGQERNAVFNPDKVATSGSGGTSGFGRMGFSNNGSFMSTLNPTVEMKISGEDHYGIKTIIQNISHTIEVEEIQTMRGTDSQLFSVDTPSWSAGEMTLQYRRNDDKDIYNPTIPRTPNFSTRSEDRAMITLDPGNPVKDKHVFGGKQDPSRQYIVTVPSGSNLNYGWGRTVNFAEEDTEQTLILEQSPRDAMDRLTDLYADTAFVIGKFENFLNLYINFSSSIRPPSTGKPTPKHPKTDKDIDGWKQGWTQLPLAYWTKNLTSVGQARNEIPLDNKQTQRKRRMATKFWIKNKEGQFLARDYRYVRGQKYPPDKPGESWDGYYIWTDYWGYYTSMAGSRGYNYHLTTPPYITPPEQQALHTRFLTLEELTGYVVTKGGDGLPARLDASGNIVGGVPDFVLDDDGNKIPYRVMAPNGIETQFDEKAQRLPTPDNYGLFGGTNTPFDHPAYPPRDGIYVVERDSRGNRILGEDGRPKVTVYRTMKDFAYEQNVAPEGEPEDIRRMVTIHMVVEQTPEVNQNDRMYWDMGVCISVVEPKLTEGESVVSILDGADKHWWEGPQEETLTGEDSHAAITTRSTPEMEKAANAEEKLAILYELAFGQFTNGETQNIFTMGDQIGNRTGFHKAILDSTQDPDKLGKLLNEEKQGEFFVLRNDLYDMLGALIEMDQHYMEMVKDYTMRGEDILPIALDYVHSQNPGASFRTVSQRYDDPDELTKVQLTPAEPSALAVTDKYTSSRTFAGEVFGVLPQTVVGRYMVREADGTLRMATNAEAGIGGPPDEYPEPFRAKAPFLPSERLIDPTEESYHYEREDFVPVVNPNHNTVQYDDQPLELRIISENDFEYEMRRRPDWVDWEGLRGTYGIREYESRGGFGWHRNGPRSSDPLLRDHYEYIMLGKLGFMPFTLAPGSGEVAFIRQLDDDTEDRDAKMLPELRSPSELPTFVIEGDAFDGAGILVVNGNLEVRTEFAYHGTLVVMGDLIMNPTEREFPRRNKDGLIVDANDNVLSSDARGYYYREGNKRVESHPDMVMQYQSKIVVQGQVFLGGSVKNLENGGVRGAIDFRGSKFAIQDVTGSAFDGKETSVMHRVFLTDVENQEEIDSLWNNLP